MATPPVLAQELEHECIENLCRAVDRVPDDIPVTKILTHEPIRRALCHQLRTEQYDLLVMGRRRRGPLSSLLASVSRFALHQARIPLLVVHADDPVARPRTAAATHPGSYLRPRPQ